MPNAGKDLGKPESCSLLGYSQAGLKEIKSRHEPSEQCSSWVFTPKNSCPIPKGTATRMFMRTPFVLLRVRCPWGVDKKNTMSAYSTHAIRGNELDSRRTYDDMDGS